MKRRKVLLTNGRNRNYIILTDAGSSQICQLIIEHTAREQHEDARDINFDKLANSSYVKVLYDSNTDSEENIIVIGYDEIYNLDDGNHAASKAQWKRKGTGRAYNPYYYSCSNGKVAISLSTPYESDPWGLRFTENGKTVYKDVFRMEEEGNENPYRLEEAKEIAFEMIEDYLAAKTHIWHRLQAELCNLKMGGTKSGKEKEKETESSTG